jgi:hypothetical protein
VNAENHEGNGNYANKRQIIDGREPAAPATSPHGDRPVRSRAEDTLGRVPLADALARQIANVDPVEEVVFGLVGPYGSGKTSLLNMMAEALEDDHEGVVVLRFNPWLFTGTEHLVGIFFEELGAQLLERPNDRLRKVGEALEAYGGVRGFHSGSRTSKLVPIFEGPQGYDRAARRMR